MKRTRPQFVLLEERYYAASSLQYRCLCGGDKYEERVLRTASAYDLQAGNGEERIFNDDVVIVRSVQSLHRKETGT